MGRRTVTITICLMLSVSSALAFGAQIDRRTTLRLATDRFASATPVAPHPLPAGKPAGIKRAQSETAMSAIAIGALAVIAIAGYAVSTHPYQLPGSTSATSTQP
jgi:hypothetical protein